MNSEIFLGGSLLWTCVWQSTIIAALGMAISLILKRRSSRAHQVILLSIISAVVVPAASHFVKHYGLGIFATKPIAIQTLAEDRFPSSHYIAPEVVQAENTKQESTVSRETTAPFQNRPRHTKFPWRSAAFYGWIAASLFLAGRLLVTFILGARLLGQAAPLDCERIEQAVRQVKMTLGINKDVKVYSSQRVCSPVIWCWGRKPVLLVPDGAGPSDMNWMGVLCHELAHYKRRDHISGLLAELAVCILPWQLLLWLAKSRLRNLSELACDDWVIASGQSNTDYAESLLDLTPGGQMAFVPAVVSTKKGLAGRVRRILKEQCTSPQSGLRWNITVVILAACVAVGVAFAQTRPAESAESEASSTTKPAEEIPTESNDVILKLIDPDGQPIQAAKGSMRVTVHDPSVLGSQLRWYLAEISDENGRIVLNINDKFRPQMNREVFYVLHEDRRLGAMVELERRDAGKTFEVPMAPVCQVHGILDSPALKAISMSLSTAFVKIGWNGRYPLERMFLTKEDGKQFTFLLPPGRYELTYYGGGSGGEDGGLPHLRVTTKHEATPFEVSPDQRDLDLGVIEMHPTKLATMIGRPAPELGPITAWKNGSPVTLADLKGQVVYLYFDWDTPNTSRDLPRLVKLHEALADKGLTIIAIYNCASLEELDRNWDTVYQRFGGVTEVPFRMAIDGGKSTFYEKSGRERPGATYGKYDITASPTSVLIDAEGKVAGQPNLHYAKEIISAMLGASPVEPETDSWRAVFESVYRLEDDQILKRIAPPFIPERMDFYKTESAHQAEAIPRGPDRMIFHWDGKLRRWGMGFGRISALSNVLNHVLLMNHSEYTGSKELLNLKLPGDWIIRNEMPQDIKLAALEDLIEAELGRNIRFEKRPTEREVIIASGRFKFHPPVGTYESTSVHMYADEVDPDERSGGGTDRSLAEFLETLGDRVNIPVIDRTEPIEEISIPFRHHRSSAIFREPDEQERARKLRLMLDHLTEQTELQFEMTTQPVEVWFVTEETKN